MASLAVGGCSFSDYRYGIIPYGDLVAKHFGCHYIHEAACAGSNSRIWRTLIGHIQNNEISAGDIILLQYTLLARNEAWSPYHHSIYENEKIFEEYDSGTLLRLTPHFKSFAKTREEHSLAFCHNYFYNKEFAREIWRTHHYCFAEMCKAKNVYLIHVNSIYDNDIRVNGIDLSVILNDTRYQLDPGHLNQLGHNHAAQLVIEFLNQANMPSFRV